MKKTFILILFLFVYTVSSFAASNSEVKTWMNAAKKYNYSDIMVGETLLTKNIQITYGKTAMTIKWDTLKGKNCMYLLPYKTIRYIFVQNGSKLRIRLYK